MGGKPRQRDLVYWTININKVFSNVMQSDFLLIIFLWANLILMKLIYIKIIHWMVGKILMKKSGQQPLKKNRKCTVQISTHNTAQSFKNMAECLFMT